jgi:cold shock protein
MPQTVLSRTIAVSRQLNAVSSWHGNRTTVVQLVTGKVLQFDHVRGYGFVAVNDDGEDVFLHASAFDGDSDVLAPGMRVEFKIMAGDRGRKAFAAHLIDAAHLVDAARLIGDEAGSRNEPVPAVRPSPSIMAARALPGVPQAPQAPHKEDAPDDEPMCDVLSQAELGQELTELLIGNVPALTGRQILDIRQGVLECARKHGWVDI